MANGINPFPVAAVPASNPVANQGLQHPFKEIDYRDGGSPSEEFEWGMGATAKRVIYLDYWRVWDQDYFVDITDDKRGAVSQILGYAQAIGGDPNKFHRWLPERHPTYPFLVAKKVSVKGEGSNKVQNGFSDWRNDNMLAAKINTYPKARLEIDYGVPNYALFFDNQITTELDRYVTAEPKPNGDYLSLPTGGMKWAEGAVAPAGQKGLPYPSQTGIIVPTMDITVTWHQVPASVLPVTAFINCIGRVNKANLSLYIRENQTTFYPHTLLLTAIDANKNITPYGRFAYDVKYTMKFFGQTHNRFLQFFNSTKSFYRISIDGVDYGTGAVPDGKYVFDEADYSTLFKPQ